MAQGLLPAQHSAIATGSFWALASTILGLVAAAIISQSVELAVKLLAGFVLAVFLGVTGTAYAGGFGRMGRWRSERKWRRHIRRRPDLVASLFELNRKAGEHLRVQNSTQRAFPWVAQFTVRQRLIELRQVTGLTDQQRQWVDSADGQWLGWALGMDARTAVVIEVERALRGSAARDTAEFMAMADLVRANLRTFYTFVAQWVRTIRPIGASWSEAQLDDWDAFKDNANALLLEAERFYRETGQALTGEPMPFWGDRVLSLKNRGDEIPPVVATASAS